MYAINSKVGNGLVVIHAKVEAGVKAIPTAGKLAQDVIVSEALSPLRPHPPLSETRSISSPLPHKPEPLAQNTFLVLFTYSREPSLGVSPPAPPPHRYYNVDMTLC